MPLCGHGGGGRGGLRMGGIKETGTRFLPFRHSTWPIPHGPPPPPRGSWASSKGGCWPNNNRQLRPNRFLPTPTAAATVLQPPPSAPQPLSQQWPTGRIRCTALWPALSFKRRTGVEAGRKAPAHHPPLPQQHWHVTNMIFRRKWRPTSPSTTRPSLGPARRTTSVLHVPPAPNARHADATTPQPRNRTSRPNRTIHCGSLHCPGGTMFLDGNVGWRFSYPAPPPCPSPPPPPQGRRFPPSPGGALTKGRFPPRSGGGTGPTQQ